ncbi:phosphoribosyltransferase-like protein [Vibrio fluvialis]|uniref:phosphoribosyltransferase-like protein n=1 Tax=Vibrio fluvialis TaxID=676 RepID=UPI0028DF0EEC|nr:hypothetical protein [Vibrio fluvialis]MDT8867102.1 hypothetical protein [Vibrio fluvialis]MDT8874777.1 hypothetical protein [Vibrio fluvialis]
MDMSKAEFETIWKLSKTQSWLGPRIEALSSLLFDECVTEPQRKLVISLLERFKFLDDEGVADALTWFIEEIVTDPDLSSETTQIVAMTFDSKADSGQYILQLLKPKFAAEGWRDHLLVNRCDHSLKSFNNAGKLHNKIVLIDEFIGSGQTVVGRVENLKRVYANANVNELDIRVVTIAASTVGLKRLYDENIKVSCFIKVPKAITEYYEDEHERSDSLACMGLLEDSLSQNYKGHELPRLGYGATESLFAMERGNTPNSVFPLFWWPENSDGKERLSLLIRAL